MTLGEVSWRTGLQHEHCYSPEAWPWLLESSCVVAGICAIKRSIWGKVVIGSGDDAVYPLFYLLLLLLSLLMFPADAFLEQLTAHFAQIHGL